MQFELIPTINGRGRLDLEPEERALLNKALFERLWGMMKDGTSSDDETRTFKNFCDLMLDPNRITTGAVITNLNHLVMMQSALIEFANVNHPNQGRKIDDFISGLAVCIDESRCNDLALQDMIDELMSNVRVPDTPEAISGI